MSSDSGPGISVAQEILGTRYPVVNMKRNHINPLWTSVKRSIAPYNPFAQPQIPTQDRMAYGLKYGGAFFVPDHYPNRIHFNRMFTQHWDPLAHQDNKPQHKWQLMQESPLPNSHVSFYHEKFPRACIRTIDTFKRCKMINGADKCQEESNDIIEICPNWCLDSLKEGTRFLAKVDAIQNTQYKEAMKVAPYNEGRTVSDVSDKVWVHGTRHHLRPDTMWADERYTKITQAEINEAKKRHEARSAKAHHGQGHHDKGHHDKGHGHDHHDKHHGHHDNKHGTHSHDGHHYDFKHIALKQEKPLYP